MSIRKYDNYTPGHGKQCMNDVVRAVRLLDKYDDSLHYNSFILGSSRSNFYYIKDWSKHLQPSASCFHFNQSADNIRGAYQRVLYLFDRFEKIDNLLIVVDEEFLSDTTRHSGHNIRIPFVVTKNPIDWILFRYEEMKAFYHRPFLRAWMNGNIDGWYQQPRTDPYRNEIYLDKAENAISKDTSMYYSNLSEQYRLYQRDTIQFESLSVIGKEQTRILKKIAELSHKNNTDVRIIVSPLYNQKRLNEEDIEILCSIFGEDNVNDFSGINEYTQNKLNYYENSHYRPCLCKILLEKVYQ